MNEKEIQQRIMETMAAGNYDENLTLAIKYAAMSVEEQSTTKTDYLLQQSIAQSQIAQVLLLEEMLGRITSGDR